jgi:hypothetical protein
VIGGDGEPSVSLENPLWSGTTRVAILMPTRVSRRVNQGEVSKIEHRSDVCVSTLAEYIEALGGRLEIRAVFKDREVRITQFEESAS